MKKILFWFAVFVMSMLVMVQLARAVEQVAPVSGAPQWGGGNATPYKSTPELACRQYLVFYNQTLTHEFVSVSAPLYSGTRPYYALCVHRRLSDGATGAAIGSPSLTNYTGTSPVCPVSTPVYVFNAVTGMCEREPPACPAADTLHSKGFFNIGTVPTGKLMNSACVSGCKIDLVSGYAPAAKQKINGIYYYFGNAEYKHVGTACTPDTSNFLSDFVGALPGETCAVGQQMISMNGVTKCFDSTGAEVDATSASAVAEAKTLADAKIAKAIQDARDAVAAAGGSASEVEAAGTVAAGVAAAGGSGSSNPDSVDAAFCADNPTASMCVEQDFGSVEDSSLQEKTINVAITPVAVGGAGSCPAPSSMILHGQQYWFQWTTYCNFATGIKPILLAFAWLSAAGLLIGGFKTA